MGYLKEVVIKNWKNIAIGTLMVSTIFLTPFTIVQAQEVNVDPNIVISTNENVSILPGAFSRSSITFNHSAGVNWRGTTVRERQVWGSTQARQG